MKKIILAFVFFSLFSSLSNANSRGYFTIESVGISAASKSLWVVSKEVVTDTVCEIKTSFRLEIQGNEEVYREILSMALTAKMANSRVIIGYDNENCLYDSSIIRYLRIL